MQTIIDYADERNLARVKNEIENGADINLQDKKGWTALMCASWNGCFAIVKLLLEKRADVNIQDKDGNTALMWAVIMGELGIVDLLLANGADIKQLAKKCHLTINKKVVNNPDELDNLVYGGIAKEKTIDNK